MKNFKTVSIIGAGALGTALTILITKYNKARVKLWDRDPKVIAQIKELGKSPYLPQKKIPSEIFASPDLKEVIKNSDVAILAVPSFGVRETSEKFSGFDNLPPFILVAKGMEEKTCYLPFQVVEEVLGRQNILHLAWVGFAKNIEEKIPASVTLASKNPLLIKEFRDIFETPWLKPEVTNDLLGVELAGALKNVMAIGIGLALASENGTKRERFIPGLISLGVQEMIKLGGRMGAKEQTFFGAVGKEDLKISSYPDSRNCQLGTAIYQKGIAGAKKELEENKKTVEGFLTASAAHKLAKQFKLQLPVVEEVYGVIYQEKSPRASAKKIMNLIVK